jgi:phage terminase Nu1 subunit (DNA packaging protein)
MSGRAHKVLYEQAARYGIPFGQERIRLPVVVRALHDFLAVHGRKILATEPDPMLAGVGGDETPGLERYRLAKAKLAELEVEERRGTRVKCSEVREVWGIVASHLRSAAWTLERTVGEKGRRVIEDALGKAEEMIVARFGGDGKDGSDERDGTG